MHHSSLSKDEIKSLISYATDSHFILFLGACGTGMSALARLLFHRGVRVRCYDDKREGEYQALLRDKVPFLEDIDEPLDGCVLIVYSLAIGQEHPLLGNACPRCSRAQLLGALMCDYPIRIAVAGSHGKSTVTALIHRLLMLSGKNPTTLSGASLGEGEGTLHIGGDEYLLYECCEYRDSFLYTSPTHAVLLNLELDHTDYFSDLNAIKRSFSRFASLADCILYAAFDENLQEVISGCRARSYSLDIVEREDACNADFYGRIEERREGRYQLRFYAKSEKAPFSFSSEIPGRVGAINTLFALSLTTILGISPRKSIEYSKYLTPIARRMAKIGTLHDKAVYYDFAHHPTEILSSIETLAEIYGAEPSVVFAPHTYSRTRDFFDAFSKVLSRCQSVYLCPIYAARELPLEHITSDALALAIGANAYPVSALTDLSLLCKGGAIVLMGAGDLSQIKNRIERDSAFSRE